MGCTSDSRPLTVTLSCFLKVVPEGGRSTPSMPAARSLVKKASCHTLSEAPSMSSATIEVFLPWSTAALNSKDSSRCKSAADLLCQNSNCLVSLEMFRNSRGHYYLLYFTKHRQQIYTSLFPPILCTGTTLLVFGQVLVREQWLKSETSGFANSSPHE